MLQTTTAQNTQTQTLQNLNTQQANNVVSVFVQVAMQNKANASNFSLQQKQLASNLKQLATSAFCLQKNNKNVFLNMRKNFIVVKVANATSLMQAHTQAYNKLVAYCNKHNIKMLTTNTNALLMRIS